MTLRKIIDLDQTSLGESARQQIELLVARGYKHEVLVINSENQVYVDPELAREAGYLDVRYGDARLPSNPLPPALAKSQ